MKLFRMTAVIFSVALTALAAAPPDHPQVVRVHRMPEAKILRQVMPQYPPEAVDARVQGVVKIRVMIGKDGHTERIRLISGHPLLAPAALQAVRQWTYEPTEVNGSPVHVVTEIDIPFNLDGRGAPVAPRSRLRSPAGN